jgi:hypothetical protein
MILGLMEWQRGQVEFAKHPRPDFERVAWLNNGVCSGLMGLIGRA